MPAGTRAATLGCSEQGGQPSRPHLHAPIVVQAALTHPLHHAVQLAALPRVRPLQQPLAVPPQHPAAAVAGN
jgi:hypothetical protein